MIKMGTEISVLYPFLAWLISLTAKLTSYLNHAAKWAVGTINAGYFLITGTYKKALEQKNPC